MYVSRREGPLSAVQRALMNQQLFPTHWQWQRPGASILSSLVSRPSLASMLILLPLQSNHAFLITFLHTHMLSLTPVVISASYPLPLRTGHE
jgi:hypothetical protein